MLEALLALQPASAAFTVELVDIDASADPALLERYDTLVPVLFGPLDEPELCHYFLDVNKVLARLNVTQA